MNPSTRTAQLIAAARQAQKLSLRDFGAALGTSGMQVKNYEAGQEPNGERIAIWVDSETPWIKQLGQQIFCARYAALIQSVLAPNIKRYSLTPAGEKACGD